MTTPDYTQKMSDLRARVGKHSQLPVKSNFSNITSTLSTINTQSPIFYAIPPLVLFVVFMFFKPVFVCTDHIDKDNVITKKMNFQKLLISVLVGSAITSIVLFAYFRHKKI